jgi:hypothetical protein
MPQKEHLQLFKNLKHAAHLIHKGEAESPHDAAEIVHRKRTEHIRRAEAHKNWTNAKKILSRLPAHTTKSREALEHLIHVADAAHEIEKVIQSEDAKLRTKNRGASRRYKRVIKNLSNMVKTRKHR